MNQPDNQHTNQQAQHRPSKLEDLALDEAEAETIKGGPDSHKGVIEIASWSFGTPSTRS